MSLGVISAQSKVDETRLKRRNIDMMPKLLELMKQEEKRLPKLVSAI